jgi:hypothetical protein
LLTHLHLWRDSRIYVAQLVRKLVQYEQLSSVVVSSQPMVESLLATSLCHPFRGGQVFGKVGLPHNADDALQALDEVGLIEDRAEAAAVRQSLGLHSAKSSVTCREAEGGSRIVHIETGRPNFATSP